MKFLMANGADIETGNGDQETPLLLAVSKLHRYERDIICAEKGFFRLTANTCSTGEGVVHGDRFIGELNHSRLLRRRTSNEGTRYEFAHEVAIYGWVKENVTKLEHSDESLKPTRPEIR